MISVFELRGSGFGALISSRVRLGFLSGLLYKGATVTVKGHYNGSMT